MFLWVKVKLATVVGGGPEGSFSIATTSQDCSTLPLIHTLYYWVLSKEVSSTIFKDFGMIWLGIEPRSPGPLANRELVKLFEYKIMSIFLIHSLCTETESWQKLLSLLPLYKHFCNDYFLGGLSLCHKF